MSDQQTPSVIGQGIADSLATHGAPTPPYAGDEALPSPESIRWMMEHNAKLHTERDQWCKMYTELRDCYLIDRKYIEELRAQLEHTKMIVSDIKRHVACETTGPLAFIARRIAEFENLPNVNISGPQAPLHGPVGHSEDK